MPRGRGGGPDRDHEVRRRIAVEVARLISEDGVRDWFAAKRKAVERLGLPADSALPKNLEIDAALREHQRLFDADDQPRRLRALREAAREALRFFAEFDPRLVGAVLDGSADRHSAICLHVFSDTPEPLALLLDERGVPYEQHSRHLRLSRDSEDDFPVFTFRAGAAPVDVTVLPEALRHQAPLDRGGERPMRRATLAALDAMLASERDAVDDQRWSSDT
jgi:hypothetical protein